MKKFKVVLLTLFMAVSLAAFAGNKEPAETGSSDAKSTTDEESSVSESNSEDSEKEIENAQARRSFHLRLPAAAIWAEQMKI